MSLDCTPSSDWDGWTPPDNMDRISDIPTIGSDQDIAGLASALADADAPPRARKSRKRNIPKKARRRRTPQKDALSTMPTVHGPVSSRKKRIKHHNRKEGLWLDKRATLHSLISKITWAKVPLAQLLRRRRRR